MSDVTEIERMVEEKRKEAMASGDINRLAELNKLGYLMKTQGGIVKRPNPYIEFFAQCMTSKVRSDGKERHSLGDVQEYARECAREWNELPEKEKNRYRKKNQYEVVNLP